MICTFDSDNLPENTTCKRFKTDTLCKYFKTARAPEKTTYPPEKKRAPAQEEKIAHTLIFSLSNPVDKRRGD